MEMNTRLSNRYWIDWYTWHKSAPGLDVYEDSTERDKRLRKITLTLRSVEQAPNSAAHLAVSPCERDRNGTKDPFLDGPAKIFGLGKRLCDCSYREISDLVSVVKQTKLGILTIFL
jgi:hypothetical protein